MTEILTGSTGTIAGPRTLNRPDPAGYEHLELRPLSPTIGAELHGLDLRRDLTDAEHAEVHRALLDWKVVFFRDQRITGDQHRAFAARWGELEVHPFLPAGDVPEVVRFAKDAESKGYENIWHSDVTWREIPALGSVLRALEVPAVGGDTLWADMAAAYDGLPEDVQARIDGMVAVHDFSQSFGQAMDPDELAKMQEQFPAVEHPVVRTHPETGRRTLYVNAIFTSHIVGLDRAESDALLDVLTRQAHVPEYQCRFHWEPDSIAFWDNRATQHYAVSDYYPEVRVMERATIIGDRPA
jgi:taurine dioxygenase